MIKRVKDILVGICVLVAILLALTTNYWLPHVNHMSYLFNDNITLGLIAVVVVLLTLYDCKLGVAFAFVVAVVGVNMMHEGFANLKAPVTSRVPKHKEGFQNMAPEQGANIISEKIEKQMVLPKSCVVEQKDFNTYSAGKDYHGFDVAGCRYDLESRTQNSTVYGPPLSWCATYNSSTNLPVPFYPLNG